MIRSPSGFKDASGLLGAGVYALYWQAELVYIGKAVCLLRRLYTHWNLKEIRFDDVWVRPCERHELDQLEQQLIVQLNPRLNQKHRPTMPGVKIDLAALGLRLRGPNELRRL